MATYGFRKMPAAFPLDLRAPQILPGIDARPADAGTTNLGEAFAQNLADMRKALQTEQGAADASIPIAGLIADGTFVEAEVEAADALKNLDVQIGDAEDVVLAASVVPVPSPATDPVAPAQSGAEIKVSPSELELDRELNKDLAKAAVGLSPAGFVPDTPAAPATPDPEPQLATPVPAPETDKASAPAPTIAAAQPPEPVAAGSAAVSPSSPETSAAPVRTSSGNEQTTDAAESEDSKIRDAARTEAAQPVQSALAQVASAATDIASPQTVRTAARKPEAQHLAPRTGDIHPETSAAQKSPALVQTGSGAGSGKAIAPATSDALVEVGGLTSPGGAGQTGQAPGQTLAPATLPSPAQPVPLQLQLASANGVLVASPHELMNVLTSSDNAAQSDRVTVQLDPPELGRVSIEFRLDHHGVQHVTITSETPEAMRQLRQMHSELMLSLERQGIGGQNMSFLHQQSSPQRQYTEQLMAQLSAADTNIHTSPDPVIVDRRDSIARASAGGRLDIKV